MAELAILQLERRRSDLVRRLRAIEVRIARIRSDMTTLGQLEKDVDALRQTLAELDASILALNPAWQPMPPRGRTAPSSGRR